MHSYTTAKLISADKAIASTIRKCEKAHATLADKQPPRAAQMERLAQQLRVLYIAATLIAAALGTQPAASYSLEELTEVREVLPPLIEQIAAVKQKFSAGTPQHTLAVRRIAAFELVVELVNGTTNQSVIIHKLRDNPALCKTAATWFAEKWGIPIEAYRQSVQQCNEQQGAVPQWYVVLDSRGAIVAGAGIIDNDFHDRPDLFPNLCALFVEERCRSKGIARQLLAFAVQDMTACGIDKLYLITDHVGLYERYGWSFLTMVSGEDGSLARLYKHSACSH